MTLPIIGITAPVRLSDRRLRLKAEYVESIRRAGGAPLLIPVDAHAAASVLDRLDGVLLTGGGDIDPALYCDGTHPAVYSVNPMRDEAETALIERAMAASMPILGVCRGAQLINVALGGSLVLDVPEPNEGVFHRRGPNKSARHAVELEPESLLARIIGRQAIAPTSFHHQAIDRVGEGLVIAARSPDGIIEAVEMPEFPFVIGVQWHPEMTAESDRYQQRIFDAFVSAAASFGATRGDRRKAKGAQRFVLGARHR